MKFYIASRLENADQVRYLRDRLTANGWVCTYDWTKHGSVQREAASVIGAVAEAEARGVAEADIVIVLLPGGRGTHCEIGMGIALEKAVFLVSFSEEAQAADFGTEGTTCAFYHHPCAVQCRGFAELMQRLIAIGL